MPNKNLNDACTVLQELVPVVLAKYNARYGGTQNAQVGEVLRTAEEQQAKYAQGRTSPGKIVTYADGVKNLSTHQSRTFHGELCSHAVDIDILSLDRTRYITAEQAYYPLIGIAAVIGLYSGGDWMHPDYPHLFCPFSKA